MTHVPERHQTTQPGNAQPHLIAQVQRKHKERAPFMSKRCEYGRQATSNTESMTSRMAATYTGIRKSKIEKHRAGKCACTPTEQGNQ